MTSNRKRASRPPPPQDMRRQDSAPRVGRTGRLGSRAERPSEGTERKDNSPVTEPDRSKPPSPSASEGGHAARDEDLPQPVRDATS